ncbi:MAG: endonuclease/exonuclease/phosphatase family protein [Candidatus Absconditabacteria bacterium]
MLVLFSIISLGFVMMSMGAWIFPHAYFSELVLSFLPYIIGLSILGLLFSLLLFVRESRHKKIQGFQLFLFILSMLGYLIVGSIFLRNYVRFYAENVPQIQTQTISGYKVLYANIYKDNQDYTGIKNLIDQENPDLIFFVEFADHHSRFFKQYFGDRYPYSNRTSWSKEFIGSVVFSKVPIQNWADDFPQGAWRYAYFSVDYDKKPIYFYLVHMSSPSSAHYFDLRNEQISRFFHDFNLHKEIHRSQNDKVVVLGDFNTTPWSVYYREFAQGFSGDFINVTRDFPGLFTWRLLSLPFIWAQIDHVFINTLIEISDFEMIDVPGSDHKGFHFIVR